MLTLSDDVTAIIEGKLAQRYAGRDIDAMKAVAKAHEERSLEAFEATLREYKGELSNDAIIRSHLSALYDTLLEQNLLRIIEPYSRVELSHVAKLVKQPVREVEQKLSQMILDKVFHGILDQGNGCLVVFDEPDEGVSSDSRTRCRTDDAVENVRRHIGHHQTRKHGSRLARCQSQETVMTLCNSHNAHG